MTARHAIGRLVAPEPVDRALRWHGDPPGALLPVVRVAHYGDCSWRAMPESHGIHTWPGYPAAISDRLRADGLAMEFSSSVAHRFDHLPFGDPARHLKLTGDPDVVLVQLGALYRRLIVLPDDLRILRARQRIGRALGPHARTVARLQAPFVQRLGRRCVEYRGPADLERFLGIVRELWPDARTALLLPFAALRGSPWQRERDAWLREDITAVAARTGVTLFDFHDLLPLDEPELRCANGYNLDDRGHARVATRLAPWVAAAHPTRRARAAA